MTFPDFTPELMLLKKDAQEIPYVDSEGVLRAKVIYLGDSYDPPIHGVIDGQFIVPVTFEN